LATNVPLRGMAGRNIPGGAADRRQRASIAIWGSRSSRHRYQSTIAWF
jgi:hypothetical protein